MGNGYEDTCVLVNAHQRVTSSEEESSNQVDRMTHSIDRRPLCPVIPVITQWAHEQSSRDGDYACAQQDELPLSKPELVTSAAKYQIWKQQRKIVIPRWGTIPQGDQPETWWQAEYIEALSLWKRQHFIFTGVDIYSV